LRATSRIHGYERYDTSLLIASGQLGCRSARRLSGLP
jgi:hypothetical protein